MPLIFSHPFEIRVPVGVIMYLESFRRSKIKLEHVNPTEDDDKEDDCNEDDNDGADGDDEREDDNGNRGGGQELPFLAIRLRQEQCLAILQEETSYDHAPTSGSVTVLGVLGTCALPDLLPSSLGVISSWYPRIFLDYCD
ncbi:hypothetical protein E3N88_16201 [Mikania micrantha]|uniref:Uncharacterized protein n=1 Tax=Mikania micrantha TaxID=192012 RepID=A0A5N6NZH7_9ASTR|nr:hypothetical protein E3N88_16201 [Mikania micrantha]